MKIENLHEKLKQCQKDIAILQKQEKELRQQIEQQDKPKFGDIIELRHEDVRRVWLFDERGKEKAFDRDGDDIGGPDFDMYRKTGQNIFTDNLLDLGN